MSFAGRILSGKWDGRILLAVFCAIFVFQCGFGLYYAHSEYRAKATVGAFNPFASGDEYLQLIGSQRYVFNDMAAYNKFAYYLLTLGGFYNPAGAASAWITPGFSLVLVVLYSIFGYSFIPVLVLNAACVTGAYFFLYALAQQWFDSAVAKVVLLLLAVNLRVSYHVGTVMTEPVFLFLVSGALLLVYRIAVKGTAKWGFYVLLGCTIGFAGLVRPAALAVLPVVAGGFILRRISLVRAMLVILLGLLPLGVWVARNATIFSRFVVSTNSVYAMAQGNHNGYMDISLLDTYRVINVEPPFLAEMKREAMLNGDVDTIYMERRTEIGEKALAQWRSSNPILYARLCLWRLKALLSPFTADMSQRNAIISSFLWLLTIVPGLLAAFDLRKDRFYWMISLISLSLLALPAVVVVDMYLRYQLPTQTMLTVPAAFALLRVVRWGAVRTLPK